MTLYLTLTQHLQPLPHKNGLWGQLLTCCADERFCAGQKSIYPYEQAEDKRLTAVWSAAVRRYFHEGSEVNDS